MKLARDFRASAREALKNNWLIAVIAGAIASFLGGVSSGTGFSTSYTFGTGSSGDGSSADFDAFLENPSLETLFPGMDEAIFAAIITGVIIGLAIGLVVGIAFFILGSIVGAGYAKFNLELIDTHECDVNTVFSQFKNWKSAVVANLLRELYCFLWSLLCVIPGIIAGYTYAMVPYIICENPELSATEACNRSKELMRGNRWRLFCLEISFIGWSLLAGLTCGLGMFVLTPYMHAARADFYREISGTRPVPEITEELPIYTPAE